MDLELLSGKFERAWEDPDPYDHEKINDFARPYYCENFA